MFTQKKTERGFGMIEFSDRYGEDCQIQKSSLAFEECIWFGIADATPQIMAIDAHKVGIDTDQGCGWIPYPVPKEVLLTTRMHLTQDQVRKLLPILQRFADTGELKL
ncbi:hypothetical protein [Myoviridae environmental samples]|nr:hypothetical protein [Myoviridae environmental samples]